METAVVHGEVSVHIASDSVDAWMTLRGNHIAPVHFTSDARSAQPYSLPPWLPGEFQGIDPLLDTLRGDFLCLPFGAQPYGEAHGDPCFKTWTVTDHEPGQITLHLDAADSGASIDKVVSVRDGQTALFQEFRIAGLQGRYPYGTHPILDFSSYPHGSVRISSSATRWCSVLPSAFSDPAIGEVQILKPGAEFTDLSDIPRIDGGSLDLSRYPTAEHHDDLLMLVNDPQAGPVGWTAASMPGLVWFALKSVSDFPGTVLWVTNGGRPQPPWLGRHVGRMGIEDVCSYFHSGLVPSREDRLAHLGIPTTREFHRDEVVRLRVLQAVAFTPPGFGRVASIDTATRGKARLTDDDGLVVEIDLDWEFVLND
jgi:hypothetical protein